MKNRDKLSVRTIEKVLGYRYTGLEEHWITGINYSKYAGEDEIAIAFNEDDINNTSAKIVLTEPKFAFTEKDLLYTTESIHIAWKRVADLLIGEGVLPDYTKPVHHKMTNDGYYIGEDSIVGTNTYIGPGTRIGENVWIGNECHIEGNVTIESGVTIGDNVWIHSGAVIGGAAQYYIPANPPELFSGLKGVSIGSQVSIGYNTVIQRGTFIDTRIENHVIIGNLVDIGHDVLIAEGCHVVSQAGICGGAVLEPHVRIWGQAGVANNVWVGENAQVMARSAATKNVLPNQKISGEYGRTHEEELRLQAKLRKTDN